MKERIGNYRIVSKLGTGGMGTVYLGEAEDGVQAAVKVLHPQFVEEGDENLERFQHEAEIGLKIQHDNVVRTYAAGADESGPYLAMEYVQGQTLRDLREDLGGIVPEELCRHIGREVACGLTAIHEAQAVHRDIKPENIIITPKHVVKIMDLGIARQMDRSMALTRVGGFVGSAAYAAPEQFVGEAVDRRADWFALGLVLHELATGQSPKGGDDFLALMHARMAEPVVPAGELNPQLSPYFEELLKALLEIDADERLDAFPGEDSAWWHERAQLVRAVTHAPLRRMRIPRETALYGRDEEIATLRRAFDLAAAGEGQVVLLQGEAGIGKTRLVDEFVGGLDEEVNFLFGSYPPGGAATALSAFREALVAQLGDEGAGRYLWEVEGLVPAFDAMLRGEPPPVGVAPLARESLQTAIVQALRSLAAERPTVLMIDDLHFAPEEGHALFAACAQALEGDRILLIGASRGEMPPAWTAGLGSRANVSQMALERLGPKEVSKLLIDALGSRQLAEDLGFQIVMKSDGNPFFVFEILRGLRDGRVLTRSDSGTWIQQGSVAQIEIPSSVLDLIEVRLSTLGDEDRDALDLAACCGHEFDPLLVAEALGLNRLPLLKRLAQLERKHGLVRSVGRRYIFDHHQIQEALYGALPELLREEYHATLGEVLASRTEPPGGGEAAVATAGHLLRGDRRAQALLYLDAALDHLDANYRNEQLIEFVELARAAVEGDREAALLLRQSHALEMTGQGARRGELLEHAMALADDGADADLQARVRLELASQRFDAADLAASLAHARDALERTEDPQLRASAHFRAGLALFSLGKPRDAQAEHEQVHGDARLESMAQIEIGRGRQHFGEGNAIEAFEAALAFARDTDDKHAEAVALSSLAAQHQRMGKCEASIGYSEQVLEVARRIGYRRALAIELGNMAMAYQQLGAIDEALDAFERQIATTHDIGYARGEGIGHVNLAALLTDLGAFASAREHLEKGRIILEDLGLQYPLSYVYHQLGHCAWQEGRHDEARTYLERALALRQEIEFAQGVAETHCILGQMLIEAGERDLAEEQLQAAATAAREAGYQHVLLPTLLHGALSLGWDKKEAMDLFAAYESPGMNHSVTAWKLTGDDVHLEAAHEALQQTLEAVPERFREGLRENLPDHRAVLQAWSARGTEA